jgi:hypothetical protein
MSEDEPFLSRWSRLKRRPEPEPKSEPQTTPAKRDDDEGRPPSQEKRETTDIGKPQEPALDPSKLPKIEELTADSDFTQFMDARVPSGLRQAALRRAWTLDPRIRDFIEVAEFQYNWNVPGGAPGYGPLPEGTDVAALLAQVIGAIPTASASEKVDERAVGDKLSQPEKQPVTVAAHDAASSPADAVCARVEPQADDKSARAWNAVDPDVPQHSAGAAGQEQSAASTDAVPAGRRRHGGALPL